MNTEDIVNELLQKYPEVPMDAVQKLGGDYFHHRQMDAHTSFTFTELGLVKARIEDSGVFYYPTEKGKLLHEHILTSDAYRRHNLNL